MYPWDANGEFMTKKWILVTGGSKRIGAEIICLFHKNNFNTIIHCNSSMDDAKRLSDKLNAQRSDSSFYVQANLNSIEGVNCLAEEAQKITSELNVLVNNASTFYPTPIADVNETDWDKLINPNFKAPLFLTQKLIKLMTAHDSSIINIVDIHSQRPLKNHLIYGPAKAALAMLTRSMAKDFAPKIRVNGISPGAILWPDQDVSDKTKESIIKQIPIGRCGEPADIAKTALFLYESSYITGQIIAVDGGRSIGW